MINQIKKIFIDFILLFTIGICTSYVMLYFISSYLFPTSSIDTPALMLINFIACMQYTVAGIYTKLSLWPKIAEFGIQLIFVILYYGFYSYYCLGF